MKIIKRAILVKGSSQNEFEEKVFKNDINYYKTLLTSKFGGEFEVKEFEYQDGIMSDNDLKQELKKQCDYLFFYFVGHGYIDERECSVLNLAKTETESIEIRVDDIQIPSSGTLIFNACRLGINSLQTIESKEINLNYSFKGLPKVSPTIAWEDALKNTECQNKLFVYSTQKNKKALYTNLGTVFTNVLVSVVEDFWYSNELIDEKCLCFPNILSRIDFKMAEFDQKTEIVLQGSDISFPFIVK